MTEKYSIYYRRQLLSLADHILATDAVEKLCIDDFLDGMGNRGIDETSNCHKAKELLTFLLSGLNERLDDIAAELKSDTENERLSDQQLSEYLARINL